MSLLEMNWSPFNRDLRGLACVQWIAAVIAGWWLHRRFGLDGPAVVIVGISLLVLMIGMIRPKLMRGPFIVWMLAAFPIGWLMSHLLLAAVYYCVLTPIGFYLRCRGRDWLQLRGRSDAKSYWTTRSQTAEPSQYFRQF